MSLLGVDAVARARRAIATAGALWREGLVPEAHAQMASALRLALEPWAGQAVASAEAGTPVPDEERALAALAAAGFRDLDRLREALSSTAGVSNQATAGSGAPSPPADFEWIWAEAERLSRFGARRLATPAERRRRLLRLAVAGGLGLVVLIVMVVRVWVRPHVTVSGMFSRDFPASYAVDGIESTEWDLPDRSPGWLQLSFSSPRRVHGVRILNGHNKFYMDRAAERIRVTAYSKNGPVASTEGRFNGITAERSALDLNLDAEHVSDIRVDVLSYFGSGAAIAEIEVR